MAAIKATSKSSRSTTPKPRKADDTFASVAKRLECDDEKARFEAKLREAGEG